MAIKLLVKAGMIPDYSPGIGFQIRLSGIPCLTASVVTPLVLKLWSGDRSTTRLLAQQ